MLGMNDFLGEPPMQSHRTAAGTIWIPAEPLPDPLAWRLRDAWAVVRGRAHVVQWPKEADHQQGGEG